MSEPALNVKTMNASFKEIYTLKLFITFKMAYSCQLFQLKGKSRFSRIPPKKVL